MNNKTQKRYAVLGIIVIFALALSLIPVVQISASTPSLPHFFWGHVETSDGEDAVGVAVSAWINGELASTTILTTDEDGNYGSGSNRLAVNGTSSSKIYFRVAGLSAQGTRWGVYNEDELQWDWEGLPSSWSYATLVSGEVNGLDLVYTPVDVDEISPSEIDDLSAEAISYGSVTLTWTSPGDDGNEGTATSYDIRYSAGSTIIESSFGTSSEVIQAMQPKAPGSQESITVGGLSADTEYYFAVKTSDEVPNWSDISNIASVTTPEVDTTAPSPITDLTPTATSTSSITLTWTATGDDGNVGTAESYDIRYTAGTNFSWSTATQCSDEPTPQAAGAAESYILNGLTAGTRYNFAIKAMDEMNNASNLDNVVYTTTLSEDDGDDDEEDDGGSSSSGGGGGGGGGGGSGIILLTVELPDGTNASGEINENGVMQQTIDVSNGEVGIRIPKGTKAVRNFDQAHLDWIKVTEVVCPEYDEENKCSMDPAFEFNSEDAYFSPAIEISLYYDEEISDYADTESLVVAYYDEKKAEWVMLESANNADTSSVTTKVSHFSVFTLIGNKQAPKAVQNIVFPSIFSIGNISVTPANLLVGEEVVISVDVTNSGGSSGDYTVDLKINGEVEESKTVTIAEGKTETVSFTVVKDVAGSYSVEVEGVYVDFTVSRPAAFRVFNLSVSPVSAVSGDTVYIYADVTNSGDVPGEYSVVLKINNIIENSEVMTLEGGETRNLTYEVKRTEAGKYQIDINGTKAYFSIEGTVQWWIIGAIIGSVVIIGLLVFAIKKMGTRNAAVYKRR